MNIKTGVMIALTACIMLVGVAAATQENPEAGSTWGTAALFYLGPGYNNVPGYVGGADVADYWRQSNAASSVNVMLYLNQVAIDNGAMAELYEGNYPHSLMQRVSKTNNYCGDTYLNYAPAYVVMTPDSNKDFTSYTFTVRRY